MLLPCLRNIEEATLLSVLEARASKMPHMTQIHEIITLKITLNIFVHWKDTEITLKNIYKGNHSDNPG